MDRVLRVMPLTVFLKLQLTDCPSREGELGTNKLKKKKRERDEVKFFWHSLCCCDIATYGGDGIE